MNPEIKTIIFDLGGVLIDWNPEYVYRKIFDNDEQKMRWFLTEICPYSWNENQDAGKSWPLAIEEKVAEYPQYKEWIEAYFYRWEEMLGGSIPETVEVLRALKEKGSYQLLALTNWSADTFPTALKIFDFLGWFDGIVVSGVEKTRKPFPEIYQILFDRYNVEPTKAVFIDDNKKNVEVGKELGLSCINLLNPTMLKDELCKLGIAI
jgi:2-haloacid dehalogenase